MWRNRDSPSGPQDGTPWSPGVSNPFLPPHLQTTSEGIAPLRPREPLPPLPALSPPSIPPETPLRHAYAGPLWDYTGSQMVRHYTDAQPQTFSRILSQEQGPATPLSQQRQPLPDDFRMGDRGHGEVESEMSPNPEFDYQSQQEDMSDGDDNYDAPPRRMPMADFSVSDDDLAVAKAELKDAGFDADGVLSMAESALVTSIGLTAEFERSNESLQPLADLADSYNKALKAIRATLLMKASMQQTQLDSIANAEQQMLGALKDVEKQRDAVQQACNVLNAKLVLVQQIGRSANETIPLPWCPICYVKPIAVVAQPCGHTYCAGCCEKATRSRKKECFLCRKRCTSSIRLHFA